MSPASARQRCRKLADLDLFEVVKTFSGFRYRLKLNPSWAGIAHRNEIEDAKRVMTNQPSDREA
jgi:hypothetical protein